MAMFISPVFLSVGDGCGDEKTGILYKACVPAAAGRDFFVADRVALNPAFNLMLNHQFA